MREYILKLSAEELEHILTGFDFLEDRFEVDIRIEKNEFGRKIEALNKELREKISKLKGEDK